MYTVKVMLVQGFPQTKDGVTKKALKLYQPGILVFRIKHLPDCSNYDRIDWIVREIFGVNLCFDKLKEHSRKHVEGMVYRGVFNKEGVYRKVPKCYIDITIAED